MNRWAAGLAGAMVLAPGVAAAKTIALLVGIAAYRDDVTPLMGPTYDVAAMRDLVIGKMGAAPSDVHVLLDEQATQAGIVAELKGLMGRSAPGDRVVIFFSGHGTSARDADNAAALRIPMGTSAFVPIDVKQHLAEGAAGALITGRQHLLPLALKPLDQGGRDVLLISDSCYSGNIVRAVDNQSGRAKYAPIGGLGAAPATLAEAGVQEATYPYSRVVMISASADTETAQDLFDQRRTPTIDGKPKGALTDALLRAYAGQIANDFNGDGKVSYVELQRAVREDLARRGFAQSPQILPGIEQDRAGMTFGSVTGVLARLGIAGGARIAVSVPGGASDVVNTLGQGNEFTVAQQGPGEFQITRGRTPNHYGLKSGAGDMILEEQPIDVVFDRLRAGAWGNRAMAGAGARIDLSADTQPAARGGTFVIGRDRLRMVLKSSAAVSYLAVNVDSHGRLVTLWPANPSENRALPAGQAQTIPDAPIMATEPAGLDHVVVLAFPTPPLGIAQWFTLNAPFGSAMANQFTSWLADLKTPYAATSFDVRTVREGGQ